VFAFAFIVGLAARMNGQPQIFTFGWPFHTCDYAQQVDVLCEPVFRVNVCYGCSQLYVL
jgi:hypothetical protein